MIIDKMIYICKGGSKSFHLFLKYSFRLIHKYCQNFEEKHIMKNIDIEERKYFLVEVSVKIQLCAQLRVCSQAGGNPVYPRFSQPDNSESWDDVGNGI